MRATMIGAIAIVVSLSITALADDTDSVQSCTSRVDVAVEKYGGPLLVNATIHDTRLDLTAPEGSKRCTLLIDTGADHSAFDTSLQESLGVPIAKLRRNAAIGNDSIDAYPAPTISISGFRLRSSGIVACIDLAWLSRGLGVKVDGLLGMDVLRSLVLVIDFDRGRLRIQTDEAPALGERVPLVWKGDKGSERPYVRTKLAEAMDLDFMLDTAGMSFQAGTIEAGVFDRLNSLGILTKCEPKDPRRRLAIQTADAMNKSQLAQAASLTVGPYTHRNLAFGRHPRANLLGLGYLSRFSVVLDFPSSAMFLRPGKQYSRAERPFALSSIDVSRVDAGVQVLDVFPLAAKSQRGDSAVAIRPGDLLIALNGDSTEKMTLFSVRRFLAIEEYQILDFLHDGQANRVVFDYRTRNISTREAINRADE